MELSNHSNLRYRELRYIEICEISKLPEILMWNQTVCPSRHSTDQLQETKFLYVFVVIHVIYLS